MLDTPEELLDAIRENTQATKELLSTIAWKITFSFFVVDLLLIGIAVILLRHWHMGPVL